MATKEIMAPKKFCGKKNSTFRMETKMKNSYNFFKNIDCKYYPCHKNIKEINCLFCYCPLYFLKDCGGNHIINQKGIKDCSNCIIPHVPVKGYKYINKKLKNKKIDR